MKQGMIGNKARKLKRLNHERYIIYFMLLVGFEMLGKGFKQSNLYFIFMLMGIK